VNEPGPDHALPTETLPGHFVLQNPHAPRRTIKYLYLVHNWLR